MFLLFKKQFLQLIMFFLLITLMISCLNNSLNPNSPEDKVFPTSEYQEKDLKNYASQISIIGYFPKIVPVGSLIEYHSGDFLKLKILPHFKGRIKILKGLYLNKDHTKILGENLQNNSDVFNEHSFILDISSQNIIKDVIDLYLLFQDPNNQKKCCCRLSIKFV